MNKKVSTILVGVSGEYFVAAELSRRGYIASITLRNTKGIDIVASSENGDKTVNIQVKTKSKGKWWLLSKKAETKCYKIVIFGLVWNHTWWDFYFITYFYLLYFFNDNYS